MKKPKRKPSSKGQEKPASNQVYIEIMVHPKDRGFMYRALAVTDWGQKITVEGFTTAPRKELERVVQRRVQKVIDDHKKQREAITQAQAATPPVLPEEPSPETPILDIDEASLPPETPSAPVEVPDPKSHPQPTMKATYTYTQTHSSEQPSSTTYQIRIPRSKQDD